MTNVIRLLSCLALLITTGLMAGAQTHLPWQPYRPDRPLHFASNSRVQNDSLFIRGGMPDTINYTTYRRVKYDSVLNNGTYFIARRHYGYISSCSPDSSKMAFPELENPSYYLMGGHTTLFGEQQELVGPHIWRIRMANRWDYYLDTDTNVAGLRYNYRLTNGASVPVQSHDSLKNEFFLGALQPIKTYVLPRQNGTYVKLSLDNGFVEIGNKRPYNLVYSATNEVITPLTEGEYYNYQVNDTIQSIEASSSPGGSYAKVTNQVVTGITTNGNSRTITWKDFQFTGQPGCTRCPFTFVRQITRIQTITIDKPVHTWPLDSAYLRSNYSEPWSSLGKYDMINNIRTLQYLSMSYSFTSPNIFVPIDPTCHYAVGIDMRLPFLTVAQFGMPAQNTNMSVWYKYDGVLYARINGQAFGTRYNLIAVGLDKLISKQAT